MPSQHQPLIILVAGPYRSGTNGDAEKIAANLQQLERHALAVYRAGHLPMIGEWVALPLSRVTGSQNIGDPHLGRIFVSGGGPAAATLRCGAADSRRIPKCRPGRSHRERSWAAGVP
jgi:hypothetical protein